MHEIKSSLSKNRLYLTTRGTIQAEELVQLEQKLSAELRKMKQGFSMISDIQDTTPASEDLRQRMEQSMKLLKEAGMGHVVRIASNSVVSNQWQRTSRKVGYTAAEAPNVAEAEALLDQLEAA